MLRPQITGSGSHFTPPLTIARGSRRFKANSIKYQVDTRLDPTTTTFSMPCRRNQVDDPCVRIEVSPTCGCRSSDYSTESTTTTMTNRSFRFFPTPRYSIRLDDILVFVLGYSRPGDTGHTYCSGAAHKRLIFR